MRSLDPAAEAALIQSKKEFLRLYSMQGDSASLIDFLNKNFTVGLAHYVQLQEVWIRDNKYFRERRESKSFDEQEAWKCGHGDLSKKFHATYFKDYIEPIIKMNREQRKDIVSKICWGDLKFIINLKKQVEKEKQEDEARRLAQVA